MIVNMNAAAETNQAGPSQVATNIIEFPQPAGEVSNQAENPVDQAGQPPEAATEQQQLSPEEEQQVRQSKIIEIFNMSGAKYPDESDTSPQAQQLRKFYESFNEKSLDKLQNMVIKHEGRRTEAASSIAAVLHPEAQVESAESRILKPDFSKSGPPRPKATENSSTPESGEAKDPSQEESTQETALQVERQKTSQLLQETLRLNELAELSKALGDLTESGENSAPEAIEAAFKQVVVDAVLGRVDYELRSLQKSGEKRPVLGDNEQKLAAHWVEGQLKREGNSGTITERSMSIVKVVTELHKTIDKEAEVLTNKTTEMGEEGEALMRYFSAKKLILLRPWIEPTYQDEYEQKINEVLAQGEQPPKTPENAALQESAGGDRETSELPIPKFETPEEKGYWQAYFIETMKYASTDNDSAKLLEAFFGNARGKVGGREFARSSDYEVPKGYEMKVKANFVEDVKGEKASNMATALLKAMRDDGETQGLVNAGLTNVDEIQNLLHSAEENKPGAMAKALELILDQSMKTATPDKQKTLMQALMVRVPQELYNKKTVAFDSTVLDLFHQQINNQSDPSKRWSELEWTTSEKFESQSGSQTSQTETTPQAAAA